MRKPRPAVPRATAAATEKVREALRAYTGMRPKLLEMIKTANPETRITLRWLRSFSDRQDREPHFSKVVELGRALGVEIEITTSRTEPLIQRAAQP